MQKEHINGILGAATSTGAAAFSWLANVEAGLRLASLVVGIIVGILTGISVWRNMRK